MRLTPFLLLLCRALWSVARGADAPADSLEHWKATVRAKFPAVPQLATADLDRWLSDTNRPRPLVLDVRTAAEFKTSHLPGAQRVEPDARPADLKPILGPAERPVVVYCSVGWRSSALAERLRGAGWTNISNLEGSIFAWANEGRPLEGPDGKPATRVHPYNKTFGRLLEPARRAAP